MSEWRFPAAFGCLVASWAILLHFTSGLPWWAGLLAGAFYSLGVVWMRDDAKREQRREDERDAWVQKVTTQQGVRVALGPLVYVKPAASHDPISGAVCQKPEGHMGAHGGMTRDGTWRNWPRPHREKETP